MLFHLTVYADVWTNEQRTVGLSQPPCICPLLAAGACRWAALGAWAQALSWMELPTLCVLSLRSPVLPWLLLAVGGWTLAQASFSFSNRRASPVDYPGALAQDLSWLLPTLFVLSPHSVFFPCFSCRSADQTVAFLFLRCPRASAAENPLEFQELTEGHAPSSGGCCCGAVAPRGLCSWCWLWRCYPGGSYAGSRIPRSFCPSGGIPTFRWFLLRSVVAGAGSVAGRLLPRRWPPGGGLLLLFFLLLFFPRGIWLAC